MIRNKINQTLKERSKTQTWLHEQTGIRKASLSDFLSGKTGIEFKSLELILSTLDIPLVTISDKVTIRTILRKLFDNRNTNKRECKSIINMYETFALGEYFIIEIKNDCQDVFKEEY